MYCLSHAYFIVVMKYMEKYEALHTHTNKRRCQMKMVQLVLGYVMYVFQTETVAADTKIISCHHSH